MKHINTLIASATLMFSAHAQALVIMPEDASQLLPSCVAGDTVCEAAQGTTSTNVIVGFIETRYSVTELYKSDVVGDTIGPGLDGGSFASSYDTDFLGTPDDVTSAEITWDSLGGDTFACPTCLLLVKDGNADPAWYLFDLLNWDGMEIISLQNFWPGRGAISHVSIFSNGAVPEPGMVSLLAIGLLGMVVARRKMKL